MLLCLSASHRTSDFATLERLTTATDLPFAEELLRADEVRGAVTLSTCNRFELYLDVAPEAIGPVTESAAPLGLHRYVAQDAAEHLFAVTAGLESVVVGEPEIAGQVRRALAEATTAGTATATLEQLFSQALKTHRAVRQRTGLGAARPSLIRLALELASHRITDWSSVEVLLVGTGRYASTSLEALRARGVTAITAWSPSGRGHGFGLRHGVPQISDHDVPRVAARADLIVCCTTHPSIVIDAELLSAACPVPTHTAAHCPVGEHTPAGSRPQVVIDLGLPRNVDPDVAGLPGIELLDLEAIKLHAPLEHLAVADDARTLVHEAAAAWATRSGDQLGSAIAALRSHVEEALEAEIVRVRKRCDADTAEAAEAALRHFAGVLLHRPSVRARELASTGRRDDFLTGLDALFGIQHPA